MAGAINTLGVLGAGQMGRGIAEVGAKAGLRVLLADIDLETAEKGKSMIAAGLERLVSKEKIDQAEKDAILERLVPVDGIAGLAGADMAIEAVTENETLKKELFRQLDEALGPDAILASNTSSISITRLATVTTRAPRVVGMHFMNPVPLMKLVEIIKGQATDEATYAATVGLAERLQKVVVTSSDFPGFIVNRILMPMINEAIFALMEGVATAEDIDAGMKFGTNHPMGPLTLADLIGLDTCLSIMEVLHEGLGDPKYRPCPLLRRMVDAGTLGRKSGQGFYHYA